MKNNKQGFSFVEIIVVIGIIVILAIVAVTSFEGSKDKAHNSKVETELSTLKNAYITYGANATLPLPDGNLNFYNQNGGYEHDYEGGNTFGISGFVTQNNLPKQYINILPLDPKTNQYYGYALTKKYNGFQLAGVFSNAGEYKTKLFSTWQGGINNDGEVKIPYLIKEYNGPNFVSENSDKYFPYNPNQNLLTAKIDAFSGNITINGKSDYSQEDIKNYTFTQGDTLGVSPNGWVDLYYSDGSYTVLGDKSQETQIEFKKMEFQDDTNLLTSIRVVLNAGTLWNKAVKLGGSSEFEIETPNAVASVRGTIFGVSFSGNKSNITVQQGKVEVKKKVGREEISFPHDDFRDSEIISIENEKSYIEVVGGEGSEPKGINVIGSEVGIGNDSLDSIVAEKFIDIFLDNGGYQEYLDIGGVGCQFGYRKISGECMKIGVDIDIEKLEATVVEKYKEIHNEVPTQAQIDKYIDESNGSETAIVEKIKQDFNKNQEQLVSNEEWKEIARADYDVNVDLGRMEKKYDLLSSSIYFSFIEQEHIFQDEVRTDYKSNKQDANRPDYLNKVSNSDNFDLYKYSHNGNVNIGIFIENNNYGDDYLKYNIFGGTNPLLFPNDHFKLEFSVRGGALTRKTSYEYYLFQLGKNSLKVKKDGGLEINGTNISLSNLASNTFYKVSIEFGESINVSIDDNLIQENIDKKEITNANWLYVGSEKAICSSLRTYECPKKQWNDIIDSLVIYQKQ